MAIPNLRNMINGYSRTTITPIQEPPTFHHGRGSNRPPPPTVPSDHPRTILVTPAAASSLPPRQSHRQPRVQPPPTKAVLKATWLHCEDCVRKTKEKIKGIAPVLGIQHLRIDTEKGMIEVEGSTDAAHWLSSFLAGQFKRNVGVLTEDDQNKGKDKEGSRSVGDQEDTEETDNTSIEREQVHHPIKEQNNIKVNLPNSINKNPNPEAKNSSSPQSPPTQPPNPDSYMVSPMREVVLKTQLHCGCGGCIEKLTKTLLDIKGVQRVEINVKKELIIKVQGTMDTKKLPACLGKKLNRKVEVVPL